MEETTFRAAEWCKLLGNPLRYRIISGLLTGEKPVWSIAREVGSSQANTSGHLSKLRLARMVRFRRVGTTSLYSLTTPRIASLLRLCEDAVVEASSINLDEGRAGPEGPEGPTRPDS